MLRFALSVVTAIAACAVLFAAQETPAPSPPQDAQKAPAEPPRPAPPPGRGGVSLPNDDPYPSTYKAPAAPPLVIRNATIMTAAGPTLRNASILVEAGKIVAIGPTVPIPANAVMIDAAGKYVTPGIVDTHSHLGVYAAPGVSANSDGNESTNPSTPQVWAEHSVWPQDPQFPRNLSGGVTTLQVLPGSANLIGGRSVVLKVVPSQTVQGMFIGKISGGLVGPSISH